jgi:hypothetical protein
MTKPQIQIGDKVREMTNVEHDQWLADCAAFEAVAVAGDQLAAMRVSALTKLKALGLTDDEIAALVG